MQKRVGAERAAKEVRGENKRRTRLRFFGARFTIGALFLLNPVTGVFDVLPDFVGFLLIFSALTELAFLDERLETARRLTLHGALVSAVRTGLMFFAFDMDESAVLSAVTILGIAELFVAVYFALSFFGGVSYIAARCDSDAVASGADKAKRFWIAFWAVHTACTVLPELAALPQLTLWRNPYAYPGLDARLLLLYKNGAVMVLFAVSLITGVWWFVRTASFLRLTRTDGRFVSAISARCAAFLKANPLQELFLAARLACVLYCAGCFLQINAAFDGKTLLPAWAGTLLLAAALLRLGVKDAKVSAVLAMAFAAQFASASLPESGAFRYIGAALFVSGGFFAVGCAGRAFAAKVKSALDCDIKGALARTEVPSALFLLGEGLHRAFALYWFHAAGIAGFALWIFMTIHFCSALMGEIKLRRRF